MLVLLEEGTKYQMGHVNQPKDLTCKIHVLGGILEHMLTTNVRHVDSEKQMVLHELDIRVDTG